MSYLLAIETATEQLSLALFRDRDLVAESSPKTEVASHCERLLPEIALLLSKKSLTVRDIGVFALDVGPGSFTSLRVGVATVMGLALEKEAPIYPVSSLEALAIGVEESASHVAPALPAGRGMIYGAVFEKTGKSIKTIVAESAFFPEAFVETLKPFSKRLVVTGTVKIPLPDSWKEVTVYHASPAARNVGLLALSGIIPPCLLRDLYIRYLKDPDFGRASSLDNTLKSL